MNPAGDGASAGKRANGADGADFAKLREILIGRDLEQLAELEKRLNDPKVRARETAAVLPEAVRSAPGKRLREAFEPAFEKLFRTSVIKHPRDISDAISPVMGPAIRSYVAAAIREFAESLNQIVEKSASWRAIRWRIEARVTGRPFTEILLARSLLYSVDQVFLIHRKSGLLLAHQAAKSAVVKDADMVSGMFSAIQDFVSDSFTEAGQELETIDVGRYKLWIQYGPKALLAGAVSGTAPMVLKGVFRNALDKIHETLAVPLDTFQQGDTSVFEPARPYLESCLLGRKTPDRKSRLTGWVAAGIAVALILTFVYWRVSNARAWESYIGALRAEPGIVVLREEIRGSGGRIEGMKDPDAPDPVRTLGSHGLNPEKVQFSWQPYLSLNTPFAAARAIQADASYVQRQIIRFETGSAVLPLAETGQIDELAAAMQRILKIRPEAEIEITGHTDELGAFENNAKLSQDRAATVMQVLSAQGIPPAAIRTRGVGNTEPLRSGAGDWDRAANRSVSFRVR